LAKPGRAKDDRRDAFVLADSLRTDIHCFHVVRQDDPVVIRLRDFSRLDDDISDEQNRVNNQFREQLFRFFPQLLKLSPSADEPWLWELFQMAPATGSRFSCNLDPDFQPTSLRRLAFTYPLLPPHPAHGFRRMLALRPSSQPSIR
jgi:hypothetical protein